MIAALLLLTYAVLAAVAGRAVLRRDRSTRAPRAAVVGWQALSTSVLLAVLLAAVALALPFLLLREPLAALVGAHTITLVEHYDTPLGAWPGIVGLALMAGFAERLVATTVRAYVRTRKVRRSQVAALRLVASPHPEGFLVVDHERPVAYCLPGTGEIVLSSSALSLLTARERALVLAHERRHLSARHDLPLAWSGALARTFPWIRLFAEADRRTAVLLEMAADDAATGSDDRRALAVALVALTTGARPEGALAASGTAALQRVRRLTAAPAPAPRRSGLLAGTSAALAVAVPLVLALAPALEAAARDCCGVTPLASPQIRVDQ